MSKRQFEGRVKAWRRELHKWDNMEMINIKENPKLTTVTVSKIANHKIEKTSPKYETATAQEIIRAEDEEVEEDTSRKRLKIAEEEEDEDYFNSNDDVL